VHPADLASVAYDFIFAKGAVAPMVAAVVHHTHQGVPASDHWPVMAVYELPLNTNKA
jgi:endonuclease/exonuclease/phosphatase (EEP) superfamily protein YafD